jgi:hypothetical protein
MLVGGALPSGHYASGMRALKLEWALEDFHFITAAADDFQRAENPGKPNITMAAFIYLFLPKMGNRQKIVVRRSLKEVARAFDTVGDTVSERAKAIKKVRI